jgi:hypothetical protein
LNKLFRSKQLLPVTFLFVFLSIFASLLFFIFNHAKVVKASDPCDIPITNPIACENTHEGTPQTTWDLYDGTNDNKSLAIQGFATDISYNRGTTAYFKIDTAATAYRIDIYRMGYYGGNGARFITSFSPTATLPQTQPTCAFDSDTKLEDCGNWDVSAHWDIPSDSVSGIYFAKLTRTDSTVGENHIFFIVRDDSSHSDMVFQTSDTTWEAYNSYKQGALFSTSNTGYNLYPILRDDKVRGYKVSYNRPFITRFNIAATFLFEAEYPTIQFLEKNGYDVSYISGVDTDRAGSLLSNHKAFLSVGHDEYWSKAQRDNVTTARNNGVNLAFLSGNEMFWKVRWEPDADNTPYRTMVAYKDSMGDATDPSTTIWTGTFMDRSAASLAKDGGNPENALTGTLFHTENFEVPMVVSGAERNLRFWRSTSVANLEATGSAQLGTTTIGYEADADIDNGYRPAGLFDVISTTLLNTTDVPKETLQDQDTVTYRDQDSSYNATMYKASSGALIFGAGTINWALGLSAGMPGQLRSAPQSAVTDIQQATVNVFADMGVQPSTLVSGLTAASASTDTTAPTATITNPTSSSTVDVTSGGALAISGTATDSGGHVAGVEVSTDNGSTWHPAQGRDTWSYTFNNPTAGSYTVKARAVDDSGNLGSASSGWTFSVNVVSYCQCSIFSDTEAPSNGSSSDTDSSEDSDPYELGVKFQSDVEGTVTGVRFYKGSENSGTHIGHLWDPNNPTTPLATATFTNETSSGWQTVKFANPVHINADTPYVASYHTNGGRYAFTSHYFDTSKTNGHLTILATDSENTSTFYHGGLTPGISSIRK